MPQATPSLRPNPATASPIACGGVTIDDIKQTATAAGCTTIRPATPPRMSENRQSMERLSARSAQSRLAGIDMMHLLKKG
jgi:hypothetical protein